MPNPEVIGPLPHPPKRKEGPIKIELSGNTALEIIAVLIDGRRWMPDITPGQSERIVSCQNETRPIASAEGQ